MQTEHMSSVRKGWREYDELAPGVTEALHFIDCIETCRTPETDGLAGLRMVNMIEAAEVSLRDRGRLVDIPQ